MKNSDWKQIAALTNYDVHYTGMSLYGNESDITYITGYGGTSGSISLTEFGDPNGSYLREYINYNLVGGDGKLKGGPDGPGQDAEWFIFASCHSLVQKKWAEQVSNGVHLLLGYNNLSADKVDTQIIDNFLDRVWGSGFRSPETIYSAWINANRAYNEYDWTIIGHQNNRMDYIHGIETGLTPDQKSNLDVKRWSGNGTTGIEIEDLSYYTKTSKELNGTSPEVQKLLEIKYDKKIKVKQEKINTNFVKKNILGENSSDYYDETNKVKVSSNSNGTFEEFSNGAFLYSREISNEIILKEINQITNEINQFIEHKGGGLRNDLKLTKVIPMTEENELGSKITTGYTFIFNQIINDTIVENYTGTGITVGYDSKGINFYKRNIKEVSETIQKTRKIKKVESVIEQQTDTNFIFKSAPSLEFDSVNLTYFIDSKNNELTPAYKLNINDTNFIFADASTGELLTIEH